MQVSNHLDLVRVAHNDPETKKMKDLMFAMTAFDTDDSSLLYQVSHLTLPYLTLPLLPLDRSITFASLASSPALLFVVSRDIVEPSTPPLSTSYKQVS